MAHRYGLLPSEVLVRASTLDLQVLDIALSYENEKDRKRRGEPPRVKPEVMASIIKKVKTNGNKG
jgi:hypothetical protein